MSDFFKKNRNKRVEIPCEKHRNAKTMRKCIVLQAKLNQQHQILKEINFIGDFLMILTTISTSLFQFWA